VKEMKERMKEERLRIEFIKVYFFVSFDFDFDFNFCGWCLSERREEKRTGCDEKQSSVQL